MPEGGRFLAVADEAIKLYESKRFGIQQVRENWFPDHELEAVRLSVNLGEGKFDDIVLGDDGAVACVRGEDGKLTYGVIDKDSEIRQLVAAYDADLDLGLETLADGGWKGHLVVECILKGVEVSEDEYFQQQYGYSPARTLSPLRRLRSIEGSTFGSDQGSVVYVGSDVGNLSRQGSVRSYGNGSEVAGGLEETVGVAPGSPDLDKVD